MNSPGKVVGTGLFCLCGPIGSLCCFVLSTWGFIMLVSFQCVVLYVRKTSFGVLIGFVLVDADLPPAHMVVRKIQYQKQKYIQLGMAF